MNPINSILSKSRNLHRLRKFPRVFCFDYSITYWNSILKIKNIFCKRSPLIRNLKMFNSMSCFQYIENMKHLEKEILSVTAWRNNSMSYLDISKSCFENHFLKSMIKL